MSNHASLINPFVTQLDNKTVTYPVTCHLSEEKKGIDRKGDALRYFELRTTVVPLTVIGNLGNANIDAIWADGDKIVIHGHSNVYANVLLNDTAMNTQHASTSSSGPTNNNNPMTDDCKRGSKRT